MADCADIGLMLGAFEDQSPEPHEYQEVAFHLARCEKCTEQLADYATLGRELRSLFPTPPLDGFKDAVIRRIENLPVPLTVRIARFLNRLGEQMTAGFGVAVATAAVAVLTVVLATPYAEMALNRFNRSRQVATVEHSVEKVEQDAIELANDTPTVISRLESEIPDVAVWTEPRTETTVIWLPEQQ